VKKPKICVVGACNLDLISYVPRLPRMGETLHGTRFHMGFGGKGANQAIMAAKLGCRVSMVSKLGQDIFGQNTLNNFKRWKVDTAHLGLTDQAFSGVAPICVDSDANNSIVIVTGANDLLTLEEIEAARPAIAESGILICQLEVPLEISLAALRIARQEGVPTLFNPAPAQPDLPAELYTLSDIFCPNESETEILTGLPVGTLAEAEAAAQALLKRGMGKVILTLGERGCLLVTAEESIHVPVTPVTATDTTGAGDAFVGSLACFLASGHSLTDAMKGANTVASLSVQSQGTQTSFPDPPSLPEEVRILLPGNGSADPPVREPPDISLSPRDLARTIDHTLLTADAPIEAYDSLCDEALRYGFQAVCVNSGQVAHVAERLAGSDVKVCAVVGFPLGAMDSGAKAFEARRAVEHGADELDMVMNVGALKSGDLGAVEEDIRAVRQAAPEPVVLKVILETCLLSDQEKVAACRTAMRAGADFVKTSTGFSTGGATSVDVALLRKSVGPGKGVKASGGIREYQGAMEMIAAGADRIGSGSGVQIMESVPPGSRFKR
jgi:ribokinase